MGGVKRERKVYRGRGREKEREGEGERRKRKGCEGVRGMKKEGKEH